MRFVGVEEREAMVAGLTVSAVSIFLLATYVKFHDVYENLTLTAVVSTLATGVFMSLAATAIVVVQRNIVIHGDQEGHRMLIDGIKGGREYLVRRMNAVSLLANGTPFVAFFVIVGILDGGKVFGASILAIAVMLYLSWLCVLILAVFRLELAIVEALPEGTKK